MSTWHITFSFDIAGHNNYFRDEITSVSVHDIYDYIPILTSPNMAVIAVSLLSTVRRFV